MFEKFWNFQKKFQKKFHIYMEESGMMKYYIYKQIYLKILIQKKKKKIAQKG